jgi:hypothetical protein
MLGAPPSIHRNWPAWQNRPSIAKAAPASGMIDGEEVRSAVTVEASRRSPWRKRVLGRLASAGYEPWLSGDPSADVRRWLRTSSERRRELRFLEDLG